MISLFSKDFYGVGLPVILISLAVILSGFWLIINDNERRPNMVVTFLKIVPVVFFIILAFALVCDQDGILREFKKGLIFWGVVSIFVGLLLSIYYDQAQIGHGRYNHLFWIFMMLFMQVFFLIVLWLLKRSLGGIFILSTFTIVIFILSFFSRKKVMS